ncbi:hypothetical protein M5D96_000721, partial [Drosophila gunungcola]
AISFYVIIKLIDFTLLKICLPHWRSTQRTKRSPQWMSSRRRCCSRVHQSTGFYKECYSRTRSPRHYCHRSTSGIWRSPPRVGPIIR